EWDFGDGSTGTGQQVFHTYTGPDSALVTLRVSALTICGEKETVRTTKKIPVSPPGFKADFTLGLPCVNTPIRFNDASSVVNPLAWSWNFGDGGSSTAPSPTHVYSQSGQYRVTHTVSSATGCTAIVTKTIGIGQPAVNAGNDTIAAIGQPLQLHATGAVTYQWTPDAGLDNSSSATPVAILQNDMTYIVQGTSAIGCTSLDTLHIKTYKGPEIYVPGAFTPDGNGHNDLLIPVLPGVRQLNYFRIYNRLGQLVFSTTRAGEGWDGKINGHLQPAGTYVWIVQLKDYLGVNRQARGTTILIRQE
ncbi:MAG: PKD domain-containing protein, partial [Bacteroidetes bacterium]|nr:PKD domain-containing protein [Bacteroidota bacterium]